MTSGEREAPNSGKIQLASEVPVTPRGETLSKFAKKLIGIGLVFLAACISFKLIYYGIYNVVKHDDREVGVLFNFYFWKPVIFLVTPLIIGILASVLLTIRTALNRYKSQTPTDGNSVNQPSSLNRGVVLGLSVIVAGAVMCLGFLILAWAKWAQTQ